jgi:hypothetical protein
VKCNAAITSSSLTQEFRAGEENFLVLSLNTPGQASHQFCRVAPVLLLCTMALHTSGAALGWRFVVVCVCGGT